MYELTHWNLVNAEESYLMIYLASFSVSYIIQANMHEYMCKHAYIQHTNIC